MAKKSKIARNEQRKVIVDRYAAKRAELKKALVDPDSTDEQREAARIGLQKLPGTLRRCACAPRRHRRPPPRCPHEVRHLACPLP